MYFTVSISLLDAQQECHVCFFDRNVIIVMLLNADNYRPLKHTNDIINFAKKMSSQISPKFEAI